MPHQLVALNSKRLILSKCSHAIFPNVGGGGLARVKRPFTRIDGAGKRYPKIVGHSCSDSFILERSRKILLPYYKNSLLCSPATVVGDRSQLDSALAVFLFANILSAHPLQILPFVSKAMMTV